jgi:hypothetical protein
MLAAAPVNGQHDVARLLIDVDDNLDDQAAHELLARTHGDAGCVPGRREILRKIGEGAGVELDLLLLWARLAGLQALDPAQRHLPPGLLELGGDEPVVGIAGGIAALRQPGLVARLLELQGHNALLLVLSSAVHAFGLQRRLDRHRLDRPEQLLGDCGVHARPAKGHASRQAHHKVRLVAAIHRTALLGCPHRRRQAGGRTARRSTSSTTARGRPGWTWRRRASHRCCWPAAFGCVRTPPS